MAAWLYWKCKASTLLTCEKKYSRLSLFATMVYRGVVYHSKRLRYYKRPKSRRKCYTHFWHEHKAQCASSAENDENTDDCEGGVQMIHKDKADGHAQYTHDGHVVHGHPHIFRVIQGRNLHLASLPGQKSAEKLQKKPGQM